MFHCANLALRQTGLCFPENAILGKETKPPKIASGLCARLKEIELDAQNPPNRRDLRVFGKHMQRPEWVVADAVRIEPVSASQVPANREKNREFCSFCAAY